MTTQKDFKRLVRGRMQKTGESYTAARSHMLKHRRSTVAALPLVPQPSYATLAGMSDEKVKAATGCTWEKWVKALDYAKAFEWPHREIARYVHETWKVRSWWTQTVTVGYERIKGLRAIGQRRDGGFEANKSKTIPVPVGKLFRSFNDKRARAKWLPDVDAVVARATKNRSMRLAWPDGTPVLVGFAEKGEGKSMVWIQHGKLADKAAAEKTRAFWGERLDALGKLLT